MNKLRVQCSLLTGNIYAGKPNKAGTAWAGEKHDVTSDVLGAVIEKVGPGNAITVNMNGKPAYKIEVRSIDAAAQAPVADSREIGTKLWKEDVVSRLQGAMNAAPGSDSAEVSKVTLRDAIAAMSAAPLNKAGSEVGNG